MVKSILGTKVGMTQVFDQSGNMVPVSVVEAGPCIVTDVRDAEKNGYTAVQLGFGEKKEKSFIKPDLGQFKKRNIAPKKYLREFRVADAAGYEIGQEVKVDVFQPGDYVDVSGVSKGKGYAGVMKRHNFGGAQKTHGQSDRSRARGSSGGQGPQRVIKGMKMAGHLGHENVTIQKLEVVAVDAERNLLLIKGAMPGVNRGMLVISETVKRKKKKTVAAQGPVKKKGGPAKAKK